MFQIDGPLVGRHLFPCRAVRRRDAFYAPPRGAGRRSSPVTGGDRPPPRVHAAEEVGGRLLQPRYGAGNRPVIGCLRRAAGITAGTQPPLLERVRQIHLRAGRRIDRYAHPRLPAVFRGDRRAEPPRVILHGQHPRVGHSDLGIEPRERALHGRVQRAALQVEGRPLRNRPAAAPFAARGRPSPGNRRPGSRTSRAGRAPWSAARPRPALPRRRPRRRARSPFPRACRRANRPARRGAPAGPWRMIAIPRESAPVVVIAGSPPRTTLRQAACFPGISPARPRANHLTHRTTGPTPSRRASGATG